MLWPPLPCCAAVITSAYITSLLAAVDVNQLALLLDTAPIYEVSMGRAVAGLWHNGRAVAGLWHTEGCSRAVAQWEGRSRTVAHREGCSRTVAQWEGCSRTVAHREGLWSNS